MWFVLVWFISLFEKKNAGENTGGGKRVGEKTLRGKDLAEKKDRRG